MILDHWSDPSLLPFNVKEYSTLCDAQEEAYRYPDINWGMLMLAHKEIYVYLASFIEDLIQENDYHVEYRKKLMNPLEIKETMFKRVINFGSEFNMTYYMSDVIHFTITNPSFDNLMYIAKDLIRIPNLKIFKSISKNKRIILIGKTDIGSTYKISLLPTLMDNLDHYRRKYRNNTNIIDLMTSASKKVDEAQSEIDRIITLR